MAPSDHVSDSTDWNSTSLSGFAAVEAALRCQVCKDLFKTPMITSCSHTFCSLCIRRALANDGKCPFCRSPEQEIKLRSNWALEETVDAFAKARQAALDLARNALSLSRSPKRAAEDGIEDDGFAPPEAKRSRTSARLRSRAGEGHVSRAAQKLQLVDDEEKASGEGDITYSLDDEYKDSTYEPDDGLVPCPMCSKRMKEWLVYPHLDKCPGPTGDENREIPNAIGSGSSNSNLNQAQRRQQSKYERLPSLNYAMLKDNGLRKKMSELGIAASGPRPLLERRHKEWTTLWNSNCDSANPKTKAQLLQDLDIWERTLGGRAPVTGRAAQNAATIKDRDFDGRAWATKHSTSFQDLIASARRSRLEAKSGKGSQEEKEREKEQEPELGEEEMMDAEGERAPGAATPSPPQDTTTSTPIDVVATPHEPGIGTPQSSQPNGWTRIAPPLGSTPDHTYPCHYDNAEDGTEKRTDYTLASQRS